MRSCEQCRLRRHHDHNPGSLLGRLWKWHTRWCPGWRAYLKSLPDEQRAQMAEKYR